MANCGGLAVERIVSDLFAENAYVVHLPSRRECLVIDPGLDPDRILQAIDRESLTVAAVLNTHGHADHIAGNEAILARFPAAPLLIGRGDAPKLTNAELNLSAPFGFPVISPAASRLVEEGELLEFADVPLEVFETPGHSCGHVVFLCRLERPWVLFGGDVLFEGSIGRTDFPDGSFEDLSESIRRKLFILPDETIVLPGHGEPTTIGQEKRFNPFVGQRRM